MKISGIYKIQSKTKPERIYIGSGVNVGRRKREHLRALRLNKHYSKKLQNHFNKYGENDLQFIIITGCEKDNLLKTEQFFIDTYSPYFNTCKIAGSCMGVKRSEDTKRKLSKANKGQVPWTKGRPVSKETREKLSKANKGHLPWCTGKKLPPMSEEQKKKLSEAHRGQISAKGMLGKKHSEETKKKMSEAAKRRPPRGAEFKQKMRDSWIKRRLKNAA